MDLLLLGIGFGFAAGVTPGPLSTLVVATGLERGLRAGLRVALAPILTDLPIVALAVLLLGELASGWLRGLTLLGGLFVLYLGVDTLRAARRSKRASSRSESAVRSSPVAGDLARGALVNLLNPHPWIFWSTAGGPALVEAWPDRPSATAAFLAGFYLLLVGSKVLLAWIAARGGSYLSSVWYRRLLAACGVILLVLATMLLRHAALPAALSTTSW